MSTETQYKPTVRSSTDLIYKGLDELVTEEISGLSRGQIDQILTAVICKGGIDAFLSGRTKIVRSNPAKPSPLSVLENISLDEDSEKMFRGKLGCVCRTREIHLEVEMANIHKVIEKYGEKIAFRSIDDLEATIANLLLRYSNGELKPLQDTENLFFIWVEDSIFFVELKTTGCSDKWMIFSGSYTRPFTQGTRIFCCEDSLV